jgi:hypothetical protein
MQVMVMEGSEEVGEDAENDSCTAELDDSQEPRERFECYAAERHV